MLAVWVLGGWVSWNLGVGYGWTQDSTPMRTGTMQVMSCHRDPVRALVLFRCDGPVTFAPVDTWTPTAQEYLRDVTTVPLVSRSDLTGQTVPFLSSNERGTNERAGVGTGRQPRELAMPEAQLRGSLWGATLGVPVAAGLGFFVAGLVALIGIGKLIHGRR